MEKIATRHCFWRNNLWLQSVILIWLHLQTTDFWPVGNGFLGAIHVTLNGLPTQASFTGPGGLENERATLLTVSLCQVYTAVFLYWGCHTLLHFADCFATACPFSLSPPAWFIIWTNPNSSSSPLHLWCIYFTYFFFLFSQPRSSTFGISWETERVLPK